MILTYLKSFASQKILKSNLVINLLSSFVENVMYTLVESIVLGSILFAVKAVFNPFAWLWVNIFIDVSGNVTYVLLAMNHVRKTLHPTFHKPCKTIARKLLGLDIHDPIQFLKMKYSLMIGLFFCLIIWISQIYDLTAFILITYFEIIMIHVSVDIWSYHGHDISNFIEVQLEAKPCVKILSESESTKTNIIEKNKTNKIKKQPSKLINDKIIENYF